MSAALGLLSECTAAGVELYLDTGRLRYRAQPGAYTEALRRKVAAHKAALIALLQVPTPTTPAATPTNGQAAAVSAPSGPIPWHDVTPDERAEIKAVLFEGLPVQILSQVLGEIVWWVKDDAVAQRLRGGEFVKQGYPPYQGEAIYAWSELLAVMGFPP
jgi:TubC N-terminal docking domain